MNYKFKYTIGSRAQVMHKTAKMTSGGLMKKNLKYNKNGKIVSKKASKAAKRSNNLIKAGYITRKGQFGSIKKGGSLFNLLSNENKKHLRETSTKTRIIINKTSQEVQETQEAQKAQEAYKAQEAQKAQEAYKAQVKYSVFDVILLIYDKMDSYCQKYILNRKHCYFNGTNYVTGVRITPKPREPLKIIPCDLTIFQLILETFDEKVKSQQQNLGLVIQKHFLQQPSKIITSLTVGFNKPPYNHIQEPLRYNLKTCKIQSDLVGIWTCRFFLLPFYNLRPLLKYGSSHIFSFLVKPNNNLYYYSRYADSLNMGIEKNIDFDFIELYNQNKRYEKHENKYNNIYKFIKYLEKYKMLISSIKINELKEYWYECFDVPLVREDIGFPFIKSPNITFNFGVSYSYVFVNNNKMGDFLNTNIF